MAPLSPLPTQPLNLKHTKKMKTHETVVSRFRAEMAVPIFALRDETGRTIDVRSSFAPRPKWLTASIRVTLFVWWVHVTHYELSDKRVFLYPEFWIAFMTNWCHVQTGVYFFVSSLVALGDCAKQPKAQPVPTFPVRFLWGLFHSTALHQIVVVTVYWLNPWAFINLPRVQLYSSLMKHLVFAILLLWEGLVYSRFPIRVRQYIFPAIYMILYTIWIIVENLSSISNPLFHDNGTNPNRQDDDAVYPGLNIKKRFFFSFCMIFISNMVLMPLFFLAFWVIASWSRGKFDCRNGNNRRYLVMDDEDDYLYKDNDIERQMDTSESSGYSSRASSR